MTAQNAYGRGWDDYRNNVHKCPFPEGGDDADDWDAAQEDAEYDEELDYEAEDEDE